MLDQAAEFAQQLPAWCGPDGFPLTWRHYQYGMDWIRRGYERVNLRNYDTIIATKVASDASQTWRNETAREAGLRD